MAAALWGLGFLSGACTTVTSLQTASTVKPGHYRLGAQLSASPYCGVRVPPGPHSCAVLPSGFPLPELRGSARYGVGDSVDLGLSAHAAVVVPSGANLGLSVEGKAVVWRRPAEKGRVHLVSVGPSAGYSNRQYGLFNELQRGSQSSVELVLPVYYGFQAPYVEWVISPRYVERISLHDLDGDGRREVLNYGAFGLTFGGVFRLSEKIGVAVGLGYDAPFSYPEQGALTGSVGFLFELQGRAAKDAAERDSLNDP
jgi:hypothetical protein